MGKCDEELTQELYEIARKIAESDRNNELGRQNRKARVGELEAVRRLQLDREFEY